MVVDSHAPGEFCWVELETSDQAAAKSFYGGLFGWTYEDTDMGEHGVYTRFQLEGKDVAAAYQGQGGQAPPHWNAYVATASADQTAEQVKALGGNLIAGPFDVFDAGRMCVLQDPTGAFISAWQAGKNIGIQKQDEPGSLCWVELSTTDTEAAKAFYTSLFGWSAKGDEQYTEWQAGGRSIGGMMSMPQEVRAMGIPSYWMPYFQVASCQGSFEKAASLGAIPIMPPHTIEHVGTFSLLRDPQSAVFAVIQLKDRSLEGDEVLLPPPPGPTWPPA